MKTRFFFFDNGQYGMDTEEVPPLQADQILVKTTRSLISVGTETACNTGKPSWKKGRHGYSSVGRVVEIGSAVKNVGVGDRVATSRIHTDTYVCDPRSGCYRIPDEVSDEDATFLVLGMVAMHVVERAELTLGRPAVVVGLGTVGQLAQ